MFKIPADRKLDTLREHRLRLPAYLRPDLIGRDRISSVMALSVFNVRDQIVTYMILSRIVCGKHFLYRIYYDPNDLYVLFFVMSADIVLLSEASLLYHHVDRFGVIHDIQPVADVLAVSVYRKLLARKHVVDYERDELLGELVWSVVIAAIRDKSREMICIDICLYHKIR